MAFNVKKIASNLFVLILYSSVLTFAGASHRQDHIFPHKGSTTNQRCEPAPINLPLLRDCLSSLGSDPYTYLIDPLSHPTYYEVVNHQWNTRHEKVYPPAYFLPTCTSDVQNMVRCGLANHIPLVPNSGGHSYESLSYGSNSTIIVDFRLMTSVTLLDDGITAEIQPGALLATVYAKLWMAGKRGIPAGMCLTVAIGGNALGGGVGYMDAMYGLATDSVVEFEMVTSAGDAVVANEVTNSDLFWALRGVGPGFIGMVTSLKMKTFDASNINVTFVSIRYAHLKEFVTAMNDLQEWVEWARVNEPNILLVSGIGHENYTSEFPYYIPGFEIGLYHIQDSTINPASSDNFFAGIDLIFGSGHSDPKPRILPVKFPTYLDFISYDLYYTPVNFPLSNGTTVQIGRISHPILNQDPAFAYPPVGSSPQAFEAVQLKRLLFLKKEMAVERFLKTKSFFVKRNLTLDEIQGLYDLIQKIPLNRAWILISTEGSRISAVGRTETAYVHRDALFNFYLNVEAIPQYGDPWGDLDWLYGLWEAGRSFDSGETYQNYPDLDLDDHFERNYAENFDRLVTCKAKWDPENYFNWTLSLPVVVD